MSIPIKLDEKGKISIEGRFCLNNLGRGVSQSPLFITNGELKDNPDDNPIIELLPEKNIPIYFNNRKIRNELIQKLEVALYQNLKFKLTNLRYYPYKQENRLWITPKTECILLEPETVKLIEPVWYDIVAIQKDGSLLVLSGGFSTKWYEDIKDHIIDSSKIDTKIVPCIYCHTWTLCPNDVCLTCNKIKQTEEFEERKLTDVKMLINYFEHYQEFQYWKYPNN